MSKIQRWEPEVISTFVADMTKVDNGDYILHVDIVKVFEWMVEHRVEFVDGRGFMDQRIEWYDGYEWQICNVPDGDYLAAIVGLMGGEE